MNKSILKKVISLMLVIACVAALIPENSSVITAASKKPAVVTNLKATRASLSSVKLSWDKVEGATGYFVYVKEGTGSFKKVKAVKGTTYTVKNLKLESPYTFEVKAFRKIKKKAYTGPASDVKKMTLKEYDAAPVDIAPFETENYEPFIGSGSFSMGGVDYYNGFVLDSGYSYHSKVIFNLEKKYSKVSFTIGSIIASSTVTVYIYVNDECIDKFDLSTSDIPKELTYDVVDISKFEIYVDVYGYNDYSTGIGEMKFYY